LLVTLPVSSTVISGPVHSTSKKVFVRDMADGDEAKVLWVNWDNGFDWKREKDEEELEEKWWKEKVGPFRKEAPPAALALMKLLLPVLLQVLNLATEQARAKLAMTVPSAKLGCCSNIQP
jgi:hypothetical protein